MQYAWLATMFSSPLEAHGSFFGNVGRLNEGAGGGGGGGGGG